MKYVVIAVLALVLGAFAARSYYKKSEPEPVDPINVMVLQMKTHAIVEHERQVAVWYRACPEVTGVNPEIFIAWPAKLSYELELSDVTIARAGDTLKVSTRAIHPDEPSVPLCWQRPSGPMSLEWRREAIVSAGFTVRVPRPMAARLELIRSTVCCSRADSWVAPVA